MEMECSSRSSRNVWVILMLLQPKWYRNIAGTFKNGMLKSSRNSEITWSIEHLLRQKFLEYVMLIIIVWSSIVRIIGQVVNMKGRCKECAMQGWKAYKSKNLISDLNIISDLICCLSHLLHHPDQPLLRRIYRFQGLKLE